MRRELTNGQKKCMAEFIQMYQSMPYLWDKTHLKYLNKNLSYVAYEKLAKKLREVEPLADRNTVTSKIRSLRASFKKEHRRFTTEKLKGNARYRPKLWYYNLLSFIIDDVGQEHDENLLNKRSSADFEEEQIVSVSKKPVESHSEEDYELDYLNVSSDINLIKEQKRKCTTNFIQTYKSLSYLWDRSHENYLNQSFANVGYGKLAEKLREFDPRASRNDVVRKIKSLRATFRKERRKCMTEKLKGNTRYKPKLWYYDLLSFIFDDVNHGKVENLLNERSSCNIEDKLVSSPKIAVESNTEENHELEYVEVPKNTHLINKHRRKCITEFIQMYIDMPYLWDKSHKKYLNKQLMHVGYGQLANKLKELDPHADRNAVIKKIRSLRACFRKERRRFLGMKLKGNNGYKPKLWYYNLLSFVFENNVQKKDETTSTEQTSCNFKEAKIESSREKLAESDDEGTYETEYLEVEVSDTHLTSERIIKFEDNDDRFVTQAKTEASDKDSNPDTNNVESEDEFNGVCQCCLNDTNLKAMLEPRYLNGKTVLYAEMLQLIYPQFNFDGSNGIETQYLICHQCIQQLQDAVIFVERVKNAQALLNPPEIDEGKNYSDSDDNGFKSTAEEANFEYIVDKVRTVNNEQITVEPTNVDQLIPKPEFEDFSPSPEDLKCDVCNISFKVYFKLCQHMAEHYPNFTCDACGQNFVTWYSLRCHIKVKHENYIVECEICSKSVKKTSMKRHLLTHTESGYRYKCRRCPETFSTHHGRVSHLTTKHGQKRLSFSCEICSKTYTRCATLLYHKRNIHQKERKVPCEECGKLFFSKTEVRRHMVRHTGARNFPCSICSHRFSSRSALKFHLYSHNSFKRFGCDECTKRFTYKCSLTSHKKTAHSHDNKPHSSLLTVTEEPDEDLCYIES